MFTSVLRDHPVYSLTTAMLWNSIESEFLQSNSNCSLKSNCRALIIAREMYL